MSRPAVEQTPEDAPRLVTDPADAVDVLVAGGLVGLPTETVYGLAADARNPTAVRRVFEVKGRPPDHPLIVHLASGEFMADWALQVAPELRALAERHWPGPLTVVVPKAPWVPDAITGGQPTVALRVPGNPLARSVIQLFSEATGDPASGLVAPSANVFGQVSPTSAEHVRRGLAGRLAATDAILDGGPCGVGVESTIVAWLDGAVHVLRPGAVGVAPAAPDVAGSRTAGPRVPGSLSSHYAPRVRVVTRSTSSLTTVTGTAVGLIAPAAVATPAGWLRLAAPEDTAAYARVLYDALRRADDAGLTLVVAVPPAADGDPLGVAVADRLSRAAADADRR